MKTAKITEKGQIAIPKEIRSKKFKTGTKVVVIAFDNHIEIRPMKEVSKSMLTAIASEKSLSKDWNSKGDRKAWKNL